MGTIIRDYIGTTIGIHARTRQIKPERRLEAYAPANRDLKLSREDA